MRKEQKTELQNIRSFFAEQNLNKWASVIDDVIHELETELEETPQQPTEKKKAEQQFIPVQLIVSAEVRYWEDAEINGVSDDEEGTLIPLKTGSLWKPVIELATGRVLDWPKGTTADIHYKVCDQGEYWLEDATGKRLKWRGYYVPNDLLCVGDNGYGDYIILKISAEGIIEGWKMPKLYLEQWSV